jgi:hypothetical protein
MFQSPPGIVVQTLIQKATSGWGFGAELSVRGPWMGFASTTAPGEIWIAGVPPTGPFGLSPTHIGVAAEFVRAFARSPVAGPGAATLLLADDEALTLAVDRAWKLAMSLPPTPLMAFQAAIEGMPRATEAERLMVQRIGQDKFRDALMLYWSGRCPMTGITDPALLLSSLWDAAFDSGLVSFDDWGNVLVSPDLTAEAARELRIGRAPALNLRPGHQSNLAYHRDHVWRGP